MAGFPRLVAASVCACVTVFAADALRAQTASHLASIGDQVDVEFFTASGAEVQEITGSRWIDQNGQIYFPYIGLTTVVGRDANGIRDHLIERFSAFYASPVIEVVVKLRVNVTGSVRQPGHYYIEPTATLIDALSVAGGSGSELDFGSAGGSADQSRVHLVRQGQLEVLDMRAATMAPAMFDRLVESGDWLYVPPRPRSRWRDNIQFVGSIVTLIASGFFIYDVAKN